MPAVSIVTLCTESLPRSIHNTVCQPRKLPAAFLDEVFWYAALAI